MRRTNVVAGVVLMLFALAMLGWGIPAQIEEGPEGMMSPRLVPQMMMGAIVLLSGVLVAGNLRTRRTGTQDERPISRSELLSFAKHAVVFAVAIGLYLLGSPLAAGAALIGGMLFVLGERRLWIILGMPAAILTGTWLLFYKVLGTAIV